MNAFVQPKNIGYLITGLGALIALFAFLFVPFAIEAVSYDMPYSFQYAQIAASATPAAKGTTTTSGKPGAVAPATPVPVAQPLFTPQFNESSSAWTISAAGSAFGLAQVNGALWLNLLLLLAMIVIVVLIVFKRTPFGLRSMTAERQKFLGAAALVGIAMLCILLQGIVFAQATQVLRSRVLPTENIGGGAGQATLHQAAVQFNVGAWIFLLGMLAGVIGAGIPLLRQLPDQLASMKRSPFAEELDLQRPTNTPASQRPGAQLFQQPGTQKGASQFYQKMSNQYAASLPGLTPYEEEAQQDNEPKKMSQFYPKVSGQHQATPAYQPEKDANIGGQFQSYVSGQYATPPRPQSAGQKASGLFRQQGSGLYPAQPQQGFEESGIREAEGGNVWPDRPPNPSL